MKKINKFRDRGTWRVKEELNSLIPEWLCLKREEFVNLEINFFIY